MRRLLVLPVLGLVLAGPFVVGYRASHGDRATTPVALPSLVDEVRAALTGQYYRPVPASVLQLGSVDRMISALGDPYTAYLAPTDYSLLRQRTHSRYSGIGVNVLPAASGLLVVSLRPGPAARAGLRVGDTIVSIDGVSARDLSLTSARARILGPTGSQVHLELMRDHSRVYADMLRGMISAPAVESTLLSYEGRRFADLRLASFPAGAAGALRHQIRALQARGATGLVLDLRQNPGGLFEQAVAVSSLFLHRGVIVSVTGAHNPREVYRARGGIASRLPLVVLVDRFSASSAEIVAAALQDNQRATLIGERTFGKALIQSIDPLDNGAALELTIARYTTPSGRDISGVGVVPAIHAVDNPRTTRDEALETALRVLARPTS